MRTNILHFNTSHQLFTSFASQQPTQITMSLTHYFYEPFYSFADFDKLFDEAFSARSGNGAVQRGSSAPAASSSLLRSRMDLHDNKETNTVTATFELPGLKKEDIHLDVHNNALTVSGETNVDSTRDESGYTVRERRFGKFSRTLPLPQGIKHEEIKAAMDNGVLTVTFPKTTPEQAPQRITISITDPAHTASKASIAHAFSCSAGGRFEDLNGGLFVDPVQQGNIKVEHFNIDAGQFVTDKEAAGRSCNYESGASGRRRADCRRPEVYLPNTVILGCLVNTIHESPDYMIHVTYPGVVTLRRVLTKYASTARSAQEDYEPRGSLSSGLWYHDDFQPNAGATRFREPEAWNHVVGTRGHFLPGVMEADEPWRSTRDLGQCGESKPVKAGSADSGSSRTPAHVKADQRGVAQLRGSWYRCTRDVDIAPAYLVLFSPKAHARMSFANRVSSMGASERSIPVRSLLTLEGAGRRGPDRTPVASQISGRADSPRITSLQYDDMPNVTDNVPLLIAISSLRACGLQPEARFPHGGPPRFPHSTMSLDVPSTLKPAEVAVAMVEAAVMKHRTRYDKVFFKAFMAGVMLSFGGLLSEVIQGGAAGLKENNPGIVKVLGGFVFPVGLVMIVLQGQELLTSNMMVSAFRSLLVNVDVDARADSLGRVGTGLSHGMHQGRCPMVGTSRELADWYVPYTQAPPSPPSPFSGSPQYSADASAVTFGNLTGSLFFAAILVKYTGIISTAPYDTFVQTFAIHKAGEPEWHQIFLRGIGCNWLVSIAIWQAAGARETISKIFAIWIPIWIFVSCGYDHVVANMFSVPLGIMFHANLTVAEYIRKSLIAAYIGNIVGALFVALPAVYFYLWDWRADGLRDAEAGEVFDGGIARSTVKVAEEKSDSSDNGKQE
ncbi:hypothetical protein EVG20_g1311 [Dentipellis fragilis]|uniref:SHSP domain-containing protein n=1 Tax=Dentipellis fragilis TaxID=205917 RepID=A0A4Y9ZCW9_9AGAM|nr:hypothetical protein EVG20_g1311 [Dentipellis fragilis]